MLGWLKLSAKPYHVSTFQTSHYLFSIHPDSLRLFKKPKQTLRLGFLALTLYGFFLSEAVVNFKTTTRKYLWSPTWFSSLHYPSNKVRSQLNPSSLLFSLQSRITPLSSLKPLRYKGVTFHVHSAGAVKRLLLRLELKKQKGLHFRRAHVILPTNSLWSQRLSLRHSAINFKIVGYRSRRRLARLEVDCSTQRFLSKRSWSAFSISGALSSRSKAAKRCYRINYTSRSAIFHTNDLIAGNMSVSVNNFDCTSNAWRSVQACRTVAHELSFIDYAARKAVCFQRLLLQRRRPRRKFAHTDLAIDLSDNIHNITTSWASLFRLVSRAVTRLNYPAPATNLLISFSQASVTFKTCLRLIFAHHLEEVILKVRLNQALFTRKFVPVNEPYGSIYLTAIVNKFFSYQLGSSVLTSVTFDFYKTLKFRERVLLRDFNSRLILFASQFSTIFFLGEFIDVTYFSLKFCNLTIIFDYIQRVLNKLVIWDHKKFLFFLFNLYREQMYPLFDQLGIVGLKIMIKGKVGVGGNSRKRSIVLVLGSTSSTLVTLSAHSMNKLLSTTTGALGFRVWLLYGQF